MRSVLTCLFAASALLLAIPHAQAKRAPARVSTATYSSTAHAKPHMRRAAAVRHAPRVAQAHRRPAVAPAS